MQITRFMGPMKALQPGRRANARGFNLLQISWVDFVMHLSVNAS